MFTLTYEIAAARHSDLLRESHRRGLAAQARRAPGNSAWTRSLPWRAAR